MSEERVQRSSHDEAALERVFALARRHEPPANAKSRALVDRVVTAAVEEKAGMLAEQAGDGRVVPLRRAAAVPSTTSTIGWAKGRRSAFDIAALLAASLVAGIYIGGLSDSVTAAQNVASAFGITADGGEVFQDFAGDDTAGDLLEDSI